MNDELTHQDDADQQPTLNETPVAAQWQGAGAQLREARERLNLSLEDIALQIKSAPKKLAALEAERWSELPERPYLRGLIRNYARVVQLDPEPLLRAADAATGTVIQSSDFNLPPTLHEPFPHRPAGPHESPVSKWMMIGVLVCAVVIGAMVLPGTAAVHEVILSLGARLHHADTPAPAAPGAPPGMSEQINNSVGTPAAVSSGAPPATSLAVVPSNAPQSSLATMPPSVAVTGSAGLGDGRAAQAPTVSSAVPATSSAAALVASADTGSAAQLQSASAALRMQFDDDSWVEVRQPDGKILSSQIFRSGTEQAIDASAPFEVVIGNAPAVKVSYRGKPIDLDPYTHARVAHLSIP